MSWAVLLVGLVLATGLAAAAASRVLAAVPGWRARLEAPPGAAGLVRLGLRSAALLACSLVLLLLAGFLAGAVEPWVDHPVFDFFGRHQTDSLTPAMNLLTQMGNRKQTRYVAVVCTVLLTLLWRRRRWLPAVLVLGTVVVQRYGQLVLAKVVDRGHPPTTLGTWPSGGCARLIAIYGTILLLVLVGLGQRDRRPSRVVVVALWSVLGAAAWIEAFSRTYLLKHWVTDVVGGLGFGLLLLAVTGVAVTALGDPEEAAPRLRARRAAGAATR
jgi:membrane-associated phospholipid phosphatase